MSLSILIDALCRTSKLICIAREFHLFKIRQPFLWKLVDIVTSSYLLKFHCNFKVKEFFLETCTNTRYIYFLVAISFNLVARYGIPWHHRIQKRPLWGTLSKIIKVCYTSIFRVILHWFRNRSTAFFKITLNFFTDVSTALAFLKILITPSSSLQYLGKRGK